MNNKRLIVSVLLAIVLGGLSITGILSFASPYGRTLSGLHTWFALLFILVIVFHLTNNGRTLIGYFKKSEGKRFLYLGAISGVLLLVGVVAYVPPFSSLIETGLKLRKTAAVEEGQYQTISTRENALGIAIQIDLRAGEHYESEPQPLFLGLTYSSTPQVAFWIEDMEGNYIDTLYVTKKTTNAGFRLTSDIFSDEVVRRPEALPYWAHKRAKKYDGGELLPGRDNTDLDGVTAATPSGHYDIASFVPILGDEFNILMEINRSYDFNDYYHPQRYPDDAVYSGSGASGQPSVVYEARVNLANKNISYLMTPVGHGHYSGQDGKLYTDMQGIDTALQLVQRVVVSF
ncbi:MAG: hypothetical protein V7711_11275 [Pseudomonadales bacterium]